MPSSEGFPLVPVQKLRRPTAAKMPSSAKKTSKTALTALLAEHRFILLYDGLCGLCDRTVRWIVRHDPGGAMRFATLQGAVGREALRRVPQLAPVDSIVLLHPGGAWVKSTAVLEIARYVGGVWGLAVAGYVLPRAVRDWVYAWVAKRRYAMFGKYDECPIPLPDQRARFLDS